MKNNQYKGNILTWFTSESDEEKKWQYDVHQCSLQENRIIINFTGSDREGYKFSGGINATLDSTGLYIGIGYFNFDPPFKEPKNRKISVKFELEETQTDLFISGTWNQDNNDGSGPFEYKMEGDLSLSS